jgi:hypothetical protein
VLGHLAPTTIFVGLEARPAETDEARAPFPFTRRSGHFEGMETTCEHPGRMWEQQHPPGPAHRPLGYISPPFGGRVLGYVPPVPATAWPCTFIATFTPENAGELGTC